MLGLLGGTFDPVHRGHLALAQAALASGAVDRVRWIPAGRPPHRAGPHAGAAHRLAMVGLAIADQAGYELDAGEVDAAERGQPSYTVLTLERLRRELGPHQPLAWILGADAFVGLPTWHRWVDISALAHLLVTERPGSPLDRAALPAALRPLWDAARVETPAALAGAPAGRLYRFPMVADTVSATVLRQRLGTASGAADEMLAGLLPTTVLGYIRHHRLYA